MKVPANPILRALAVTASGAVMALAMPPTAWWLMLFPCLSFFYTQLADKKGKGAFLTGWLFGLGYFTAGLYWIGNALLVPGNEFKWVWPLAILGLPVGLAIFTGLAAAIATWRTSLRTWRGFAAFIVAMMLAEWLRGHIFTGFPWNLYGYSWAHTLPMVQGVSLGGIYTLTAITTLWATLPGFLLICTPSRKCVTLTIAIIVTTMAALYSWGSLRLKNIPTRFHEDIVVRLVQPNIPQKDKWRPEKIADNIRQTVAASTGNFIAGKTYAIVWPETAISDFILEDPRAARYIRDSIMQPGATRFLIAGTLRHTEHPDGTMTYHNSIVTYDTNLNVRTAYDKSHLVPFGEYIPFKDWIPLHPFASFSGFAAGGGIATQKAESLPPFSGLICYEVIFPGKVATESPRPEWMINVTNDGWYGDSPGPYQHLTMAIYRAVEEGLPVARSANTGISAIIDPNGRILSIINYNETKFSDVMLPFALQHQTLYSRLGDAMFFGIMIAMCSFIIAARRSTTS